MKRTIGSLTALLFFLGAASAGAAPWTPPKPKQGHAAYDWLDYGCTMNAQGQTRSFATVRTDVYKLKGKYGMFRQKVKVQIDRIAGYDDSDPTWREVDSVTGSKESWFQKTVGLPDGANTTLRTGLQPDQATLTAKVTVWLKRYGSPKAVWRYKARSSQFSCPDGFSLYPAPALPSPNGG